MQKATIFDFCQNFGKVPIYRKIYSDFYTPVLLLQKIAKFSKDYYLFESVKEKRWSRYSFLGLNPKLTVEINDDKLIEINDGKTQVFDDAISHLKILFDRYNSPRIDSLPIFTGGAVGYFSYESSKYFDNAVKFNSNKTDNLPDIKLMFFDNLIVFDHYEQYLYLIANLDSSNDFETEYNRCLLVLDDLQHIIESETHIQKNNFKSPVFSSNTTKEKYIQNVQKAKEYIKNGDIFQVVPSQRFCADFEGNLFDIYRNLRLINPSPYLYYIKTGDLEIAGCSPETLIHIVGDEVITYPIAGTRKRGVSEEEDKALELELLNDPKEIAEHNMLVDLGRNDIGKISKIGSVEVRSHLTVERFSHVMHLTSVVAGKLKDGVHIIDALGAVLPAGTLSGAPKIRAMQIIDELEPTSRGIYGGAICYFGYNGNMDCCIAIRTVIKNEGKLSVQSGGGIVLDSDPKTEYEESINKAKAVLAAVSEAAK